MTLLHCSICLALKYLIKLFLLSFLNSIRSTTRPTARRSVLVKILSTAAQLSEQVVQQIHSQHIEVMELEHYGRQMCSKPSASTVMRVVNKLKRR